MDKTAVEPGKPWPFDEVYRTFANPVYRFCLSMVRDPALAEDIGAETFTAAYRAYEKQPVEPDGLRPWLFRIARNQAIDHHRREKRRYRVLQKLAFSGSPIEDAQSVVEINAELERALNLLAKMNEKDRRILGLRIGAGLSYQEMSVVLGMKEHSVSAATNRAIERFKRLSRQNP